MGVLAASMSSAIWLVKDNILFKNVVEIGASLESLVKGVRLVGSVCGGLLKPSHGHHVVHNIEAGVSTMSCYGQVGGSYNGGQPIYPELNGHAFHTKHAENMIKGGDATNNVPYGYSDVGQIYDQHAYTQKNPATNEGNNVSLKGITDFQDSMQFQQLASSNQCGNEVVESKTLVITDQGGVEHGHFPGNNNGRVQESGSLHLIGQPEGSQAPGGPAPQFLFSRRK